MRSVRYSALIALLLGALGSMTASAEKDLVPIQYLSLKTSDGAVVADLLVLHPRNAKADEPKEIQILETQDGLRARLTAYFDTESGVMERRLEDLGSGWSIDWQLDGGMTNLGDPADYATPWQWFEDVEYRRKKEQPPSRYSLETSDGALVEWEEPWDAGHEVTPAKREALATLAASFYDMPPPESVRREVHLLGQFLERKPASGLESYKPLIELLLSASRVAGESSKLDDPELEVEVSSSSMRRDRVAKLLEVAKPLTACDEDSGATASPAEHQPP
jgi:hypothetical protein